LIDWLRKKHKITDDLILSILTIFVRKPKARMSFSALDSNKSKVFPLNNSFEIEICDANIADCEFKNRGLINLKYEPF